MGIAVARQAQCVRPGRDGLFSRQQLALAFCPDCSCPAPQLTAGPLSRQPRIEPRPAQALSSWRPFALALSACLASWPPTFLLSSLPVHGPHPRRSRIHGPFHWDAMYTVFFSSLQLLQPAATQPSPPPASLSHTTTPLSSPPLTYTARCVNTIDCQPCRQQKRAARPGPLPTPFILHARLVRPHNPVEFARRWRQGTGPPHSKAAIIAKTRHPTWPFFSERAFSLHGI